MAGSVVSVVDLAKVYPGGRDGASVRALDGVSFAVGEGEFFGFLGPNGAGKTTTIRILATLTRPSSGSASVAGLDVVSRASEVRARIGLAMQTAAVEGMLTGRENLELAGRLHRVPEPELRRRVSDLLDLMGLAGAADRLAGAYSGGMRRRLDLATALVHRPEVLFLDEPTEGLDPQSRAALWDELVRVNRAGTTMFLTTHYMEEADRLCERLAIVDDGRIVVEGAPAALKRAVASDTVDVSLDRGAGALERAREAVTAVPGIGTTEPIAGGLRVSVADGHAAIPPLLRALDAAGVMVEGLRMREPSLDDVFLRYCGRHIREEAADVPIALGWM